MHSSHLEAYQNAIYIVDRFKEPIRIGSICKEADHKLDELNATTWAFLTTWNPYSKIVETSTNAERNDLLKKDLEGFTLYTGRGEDPLKQWPAEESFFVVGISRDHAIQLGKKYKQNAIVFGKKGQVAELVLMSQYPHNVLE